MILAIDTATRVAGLSIYDGQQTLCEETWVIGEQHTVEMLQRIDRIFHDSGLLPANLQAVAVMLGPGSFTGLRSGLSLAKGMAMALAIPILGVPTLDVTAAPHRYQPLPVCAVVQAGRGRLCWGFYGWSEHQWQALAGYRLGDAQDLCDAVTEPAYYVGEIDITLAHKLRTALGERAVIPPSSIGLRRTGTLAEMAWQRLQNHDTDDITLLSPIYLHDPTPGKYAA
jgi:tRNA threonylcarbamoyladenosine biosynthesis protein TsaB